MCARRRRFSRPLAPLGNSPQKLRKSHMRTEHCLSISQSQKAKYQTTQTRQHWVGLHNNAADTRSEICHCIIHAKMARSYLALREFSWARSMSSNSALKNVEFVKRKAQIVFPSMLAAIFCLRRATSRGRLRLFANVCNARREHDVGNARAAERFVTF